MAGSSLLSFWSILTILVRSASAVESSFLWLSDIQLDPYYGTPTATTYECANPRNTEKEAFGQAGCDSPPELVRSAIQQAQGIFDQQKFDFVIVTGDLSRQTEALKNPMNETGTIMRSVSDMLTDAFDDIHIIPTIGSDDVTPAYFLDSSYGIEPNPQLKIMSEALSPLFKSDDERATFLAGGFFARNVTEKLTVLSLNTVIYSTNHKPKNGNDDDVDDPLAQFGWLEHQLQQAQTSGRVVYIIGHIPPTVGSRQHNQLWRTVYLDSYYEVLSAYFGVVKGQLFGHLHSDEFRVPVVDTSDFRFPDFSGDRPQIFATPTDVEVDTTESEVSNITNAPTAEPSSVPSSNPSNAPSATPSSTPSSVPSAAPSSSPSVSPSSSPSGTPSSSPSSTPSETPTNSPTTSAPTDVNATHAPTSLAASSPIDAPAATSAPSPGSTSSPTTPGPTSSPSIEPTGEPSSSPSAYPTSEPSALPTLGPTIDSSFPGVLWLCPSISPVDGSNPSIRLMHYEIETGIILDYDTYYLDLRHASKGNGEWKQARTFRDSFGISDVSRNTILGIVKKLEQDPLSPFWDILLSRQNVHAIDRNEVRCDHVCQKEWLCTFFAITEEGYNICLYGEDAKSGNDGFTIFIILLFLGGAVVVGAFVVRMGGPKRCIRRMAYEVTPVAEESARDEFHDEQYHDDMDDDVDLGDDEEDVYDFASQSKKSEETGLC